MTGHRHTLSALAVLALCLVALATLVPAAAASDSARTGYDAESGTTNLSADWQTNLSDGIDAVVTADNTIYVTTANYSYWKTSLAAYDTDGTRRWKLTLNDSEQISTALSSGPDGGVYVASPGGITAYEANGSQRWDTANSSCACGGSSRPVVTDRAVYHLASVGENETLFSLDRTTGDVQWRVNYSTARSAPADPLAARNGTVYAAVPGVGLTAYDRDGTRRFRQYLTSPSDHPVVTPNGTALLARDGTLTAVDAGNGSVVWERQTGSATAPAVAPDGTVAAPTATNEEYNQGYGITVYDADGHARADWSESTLDPGELDVRDQPLLTDGGLVTFSGGNSNSPTVHVTQRNGESVDELAPDFGFGTVSPLDSGRVLLVRGGQLRAVGSADAGDGTDTSFNASLTVDRFPEPGDPLSVSANASTGVGALTYEWAVNGSTVDCASASCELDVDYPAAVSLTVTDAEGSSETLSTVVRASSLALSPVENIPIDVFGDAEALTDDTITFEANTSAISHDLDDLTWSVDGPVQRSRNGTDALDVVFSEPGRHNVTAVAEVTDPASGQTESVETTMDVRTYDLRESLGRFEFVYEGAADSYQGRVVAAKIQDRLPDAVRQVAQRTDGLPESVTLRLTHPDTRDACLTCAGDGTFYHRVDASVRIEVVRHELVHLAQDHMNTEQDGDWNTLIEGHASHEQDPRVDIIDEKPSRSAFLDWGGTFDEYQQGSAFVAAFYNEYGRQAFLDLLRDSLGRDMHTRFEAVTGESFDSFYADWTPTNTSREIGYEPGFTYHEGTLLAVVTGDFCSGADCSLPGDITAAWDVDDDGTFEKTGATVSWSPEADGEYPITLRYERNGSALAQTQVLDLSATESFTVVGDARPTDPDDDGRYEDVNGDGTVDVVDVSAFFEHYQGETIQDNVDAFDYNGDGSVTIADVNRLFSTVSG